MQREFGPLLILSGIDNNQKSTPCSYISLPPPIPFKHQKEHKNGCMYLPENIDNYFLPQHVFLRRFIYDFCLFVVLTLNMVVVFTTNLDY